MEGEFILKKAEKWRNGENAVGRIQMTGTRVNPQKQETKSQSSLKHMSMCGSYQEGEKIRAVAKAEMHIEIRLLFIETCEPTDAISRQNKQTKTP